jgi:hypothetical protein
MKTNLLKTNGAMPDLCQPSAPIECDKSGELFNANTLSNSVRVCLAAGEVAHLTAFKLADGNTIKVFIDAKGNGVECANCGPDDRVPLMDCDGCHQNQLNEFKRQTYVVGPNCFVFVSDAPVGEPFVTMTKVALDQVPAEFICQEPCYPCLPVSITTIATGETSANVTIVSGSDAHGREVTVKLFNGAKEYEQVGVNGDVLTFAGLQPNTTYSVVATNDCGEKDTSQVTTATPPPCPTLVLTAAATGTNSIAVTVVSGGSAWIELNGEKRYLANGETTTFNDLTPAKEYFAIGTSDCGSIANVSATTAACPAISLTQTSNTTSSITVTLVSGGTASVFVGGDEAILANGASYTFTDLTAGKNYTAKVISECGNKANFTIATAPCPAVDFTALALSTTSLQVTAVAGMPLKISVVSQSGAVLDSVDGVSSTVVFTDLPEGAIVTVKAVNECGKTKQLNVNLPDPAPVAEPFCASLNLKDESPKFAGFAYFPEDSIDPAATVPFRGGFIYPTRGKGHTVKVTDALGAVIGYAANKSDCANPCCEPVVELKKCDGSVATSDDLFITKGDLLDCEGNPLPCDAKLKQCCDTEVIVTRPTGLFNSTGCITGEASGTDSDGRIVWRSRDNTCVVGGGITGADNQYVQFDIENPFDCDALIEIDMQALCESFNSQLDSNQSVTYLHCISESLNVEPYPYGSTGWANDTNGWAWTTTDFNAQSGSAAGGNQPPIFPNSISGASPQTTSTAKYRVNISALATKTFYAQMWIILSDVVIGDYFNLHAGFDRNSFAKITKGGVLI